MELILYFLNLLFYVAIILAVIYLIYIFYLYKEPDGAKYDFEIPNSSNKNMKLILLRHGARSQNETFYTELNDIGKEQAHNLVSELNKYGIDEIISSPFIRTLQTVYPFAESSNKPIKIDYGLYEYRMGKVFKKDANVYTTNDIQQQSLINKLDNSYTSSVQPDKLELNRNEYGKVEVETTAQLKKRVYNFFNNILSNPSFNGKTILIVSHAGVINMMKEYFKNKGDYKKFVPDSFVYNPYPFAHYVVYEQKSEDVNKK